MKTNSWLRVILLLACANGAACISNTVVNIGQKSSLEKQLMGEVEPLTEEEMLISSIRAPGLGGATSDDIAGLALSARRRQLFNRDDLDELKAQGCLAETKTGRLIPHACAQTAADVVARVSKLVAEENADRGAILDWAVSTDPVLTRADRAQLEEMLGRILWERGRKGDWFEQADGSFKQK